MLLATCTESTALCPRIPQEGSRLIYLMPDLHPDFVVCSVDGLFVDFFSRLLLPCCRYFIRTSQPVYGWWFYYMWSNVIGHELKVLHPKLNVRTAADVDELLGCEVRM